MIYAHMAATTCQAVSYHGGVLFTMNQSILFIIPSLNFGGAEMLLLQQARWLKGNGWKPAVVILSGKNDQRLVDELGLPADQILVLDSPHAVLNNAAIGFALKNKSKLTGFATKHGVENIVAHLPLSHFWGRLLKLKMPSAQLLIYHHSMQYQASPLNTFSKKVFNKIQKVLAAKTDDVSVCISESVKRNIKEHFVLNNPIVLYNAVPDQTDTMSLLADEYKKDPETHEIKMVIPGRLHPAKGHLFFLKVFKQLIDDMQKPLKLRIAGGGGLENEINEYIISSHIQRHVSVTGFLSNEMLLQEIKKANIVLIPSISEGLGIVGIEALMFGKTVIASDAGGLKEIFTHGKNGYLFKAGQFESCLNVLKYVLSNLPSSLIPISVLREDYERRFSFETYARNFAALLKKTE